MQQILRRVRRSVIAVVACAVLGTFALAPSAFAQDPAGQGSSDGERMDPRKIVDQRMAVLTEALKLDTAQQSGVRWLRLGESAAAKHGPRQLRQEIQAAIGVGHNHET